MTAREDYQASNLREKPGALKVEETEGIVLKSFDFRETSKIVVFFSKDFGIIKGLAKGCRANRKKFGFSLEDFCYDYLSFYQSKKGNIHLLGKCEVKNYYPNIRENLLKSVLVSYWSEVLEGMTKGKDKPLFDFFLSCLEYLECQKEIPVLLKPYFELNVLRLSGYSPLLDYCVSCKQNPSESKFSAKQGGILCPGCYSKDGRAISIPRGIIPILQFLSRTHLDRLPRLKIPFEFRGTLKDVLHYYLFYLLEKRPRSLDILEQLQKENFPSATC